MLLVLQFFVLCARILCQKCRAPPVNDCLSLSLASAKTKATNKSWAVITYSAQGDEGVLRIELFDFPERLRRRMRFRKLAQSRKSGTQKILHCSFPIELINITAIPFIARPVEVRHVSQENCFPRQERADWSARNSLEKIPVVPAS